MMIMDDDGSKAPAWPGLFRYLRGASVSRYDESLEPASQGAITTRTAALYMGLTAGALTVLSVVVCYAIQSNHQLSKLAFVLACLPWLPILLKVYFKQGNTAKDSVGILVGTFVAAPIEIFCLLALAGFLANLVHGSSVVILGALVGLVWLFVLYVVFLAKNKDTLENFAFKDWFFLVLLSGSFAWAYGYAVVGITNRVLDHGTPDIYHSQITGKHTTRGKSGTHYYLQLSGGPDPSDADLQVDSTQYAAAQAGDSVCVAVYPGALGFRWMHSVPCPDHASP
jgi:hypothetical protein